MKYLLSLLITLMASTLHAQWAKQSSGTSETLSSVSFYNESLGLAVGGNSTILRTDDGGSDWNVITSNTDTLNYYDVEMISDTTALLVGEKSTIKGTVTAGTTWSTVNHDFDTTSTFREIEVTSSGTYFYLNGSHWLYRNSDSLLIEDVYGLVNPSILKLRDVSITGSNEQVVYAAALRELGDDPPNYTIYKSTDSGNSWDPTSSFIWGDDAQEFKNYYKIDFPSEATGYISGAKKAVSGFDAHVQKTTDGGESFTSVYRNSNYQNVTDIYFHDDQNGWIVLDNEAIFRTQDGGENWTEADEGISDSIYDLVFVDSDIGFVVGSDGSTYKTTNGGGAETSVADGKGQSLPSTFKLEQNYPNPFNPVTNIQFQLKTTSHVSLNVYNVMGKKVAELVDEVKSAGSYQVAFDAADLASGIYIYQMNTEGFSEVRKMVLVK